MKYLRKLLSGVTAFAVSLTALPFSPLSMTTNAAEIIYGDVNGDGKVNIFDLTLLKREINSPGTTNISQKAGDVNSDGILNIYDVREVLNFLLGKTDVFSANAGAVVSDDTENLTVFPAVSNSDYQLSEGNSKPFETSPIDGLIVSAEKNALDYDGQLKITEMSETDGKALNETLTESGILMIEGWNINANLKADEYLPGTFHSDYDLTTLDMPEEMYKDVVVLRVDDDGNIQQYAVERNGSHLSWDSSQNSFLVLGLITTTGLAVAGKVMTLEALYWTACVVAGVTIIDYAAVRDKESLWNQKEMQSLHFYETDDFVIWYSTEDENFYRREKRIRDTENKTYQEAYNDALWIYGSDYATKLNGIKKLNEKAIEIQKTMLADDAQYQADIAARENLPADVILLADYLKTAKDYLETEQKTGKLGYKPDILLTPNAKDLGNEQKPDVFWRNPYIAVKRDQSMMYDTQSYPEKTAPGQLYGTKFRAELADDMLITVTHEMFHIHQHKKYNANDKTHLDFTEFSANILEMQCAEYYKEHQRITTPYKNENIGGYETYAIPIDRNDIASGTFDFDENVLKAHGYTLAEFYEYLKEKTGKQMTAWKLVDAYSKQSNSVIKAIMKVYGINSKKDLSDYWKGYLQSIPDKLGNRTKEIQNHTSDSQAAMPSYLRKIVLSKNHQSEKITVNAANFTAKLGHIYCTDTDNYSVLFVRDKGFSSSLPTFGFAFSKPSGITQSGQTISGGIALNFKNWDGYFYERQGSGNSGTGTYTAWLLEPPEAPVLVYDEEIHAFHLNLQEDRSQAGKNKITDCFRVIWKVNGIEVYSQLIDFDNWTDDIIVYPKEVFWFYGFLEAASNCDCKSKSIESFSISPALVKE